jgi:rhodanese-related sulfurtransferase
MKALFLIATITIALFAKESFITKGVKEVKVVKDGHTYVIKREVPTIPKQYQNTLRGKIAPMKVAEGIETVGELEVINYIKEAEKSEDIILVDARTEDWYESIHIPTALNVPFMLFKDRENAIETLNLEFNVEKKKDGTLDFSKAKTVVVYCNGAWCLQSIQLIRDAKYSLLNLGYPKEKIKYYRGGMQSWVTFGLTTIGKSK